uniref:Uncharacterized protein n=1 Tax=Romanomermis culicivorax TaxID=13658 RepID=A0A915ISP4_ROMCU
MNPIPKGEPSFASDPPTYVCNRFALQLIIFDEEFHMETSVEQIDIEESDYTANPNSPFHFYSMLINIIDFPNRFSFPVPVYAYPMPTTASVHMLTTEELLDCPTLGVDVEPADEELLDMPIFDLNIAKLLLSTDVSALPTPAAPSDLTATATQITNFLNFLKLTLDEISTLPLVPMEEYIPIQHVTLDAEMNTPTDQTLTDIPEESTMDQSTSMDVVPVKSVALLPLTAPTVDLRIYLATPAVLPGPPIIATVATPRYSAPVRFSKHIISDQQWQALAAALTAYHFHSPLPGMLFPEHHWMDYPDPLKEEIQRILLPQLTPAAPIPQISQPALVIAQAAVQLRIALPAPPVLQLPQPGTLLPPTAPVDVGTHRPPACRRQL